MIQMDEDEREWIVERITEINTNTRAVRYTRHTAEIEIHKRVELDDEYNDGWPLVSKATLRTRRRESDECVQPPEQARERAHAVSEQLERSASDCAINQSRAPTTHAHCPNVRRSLAYALLRRKKEALTAQGRLENAAHVCHRRGSERSVRYREA